MLTKENIKQTLIENIDLLNQYHINRIGIFGSFARGENTTKSDIDFLVDFSSTIDLFEYVHLIDDISSLFSVPVDIVPVDGIKPYFRNSVLNEVEWLERL